MKMNRFYILCSIQLLFVGCYSFAFPADTNTITQQKAPPSKEISSEEMEQINKFKEIAKIKTVALVGVCLTIEIDHESKELSEAGWYRYYLLNSLQKELQKVEEFKYVGMIKNSPCKKINKLNVDFFKNIVVGSDVNHAAIYVNYVLNDRNIKDNLCIENTASIYLFFKNKIFVLQRHATMNYQSYLKLNTPELSQDWAVKQADDMLRFILLSGPSETTWKEILNQEKEKAEKTVLPNPNQSLVHSFVHQIKVARGEEGLTWIEMARTADWSNFGQWIAARNAFVIFFVIVFLSSIANAIKLKVLAEIGLMSSLYFLYLTLAAIF